MYGFPPQPAIRLAALAFEHSAWTLGQVVPYLRLNGVTPPEYTMPFCPASVAFRNQFHHRGTEDTEGSSSRGAHDTKRNDGRLRDVVSSGGRWSLCVLCASVVD